jgi:hypothetical protein
LTCSLVVFGWVLSSGCSFFDFSPFSFSGLFKVPIFKVDQALHVFVTMKVYSPKSMRPARHSVIVKAGMAVAISFWIAVVSCVLGCAEPALAGLQANLQASSSANHAGRESHAGRMADKEDCHHSGGNPSVPVNGKKSGPSGAMSCCPFEITLAQKWDTAALLVNRSHGPIVSSDFSFRATRFSSSAESVSSIWHSGRDTLLETHLLRI